MNTRKWLAECHAWLDAPGSVEYQSDHTIWYSADAHNNPVDNPELLWRIKPATITINGTELPKPVSMGPSWLWFGKSEHTAQRAVYFNTREDRDLVYAELMEVLGS